MRKIARFCFLLLMLTVGFLLAYPSNTNSEGISISEPIIDKANKSVCLYGFELRNGTCNEIF
ncbi:unnamed protein product [Phyllotreta striolata]|uniref:Uncharacterized protein n=1 Tax=Phyllotreta striolata TaxID=444603 RepID=A0A9N9TG04_PHYSR|nr:unnamed protein product [Phyllotreta striolata]